MKKTIANLIIVVLLVCPVLAREKLGHEPERLNGNVKSVRTKTSRQTKESGKWVNQGGPFEKVEKIPGRSRSGDEDTDGPGEDTGSFTLAESDPIKVKQAEGYNAGYGTSHGGYGFYKADKDENILETVHYSSKGELAGKDYYTYDADGREIEKAGFGADGSLVYRRISTYDSEGNRTDETQYLPDGTVQRRCSWTYDYNNNVIQESLFEAALLKYKLTYSYEYDRVGNWVKRVTVSEGFDFEHSTRDTMEVAERVITYR